MSERDPIIRQLHELAADDGADLQETLDTSERSVQGLLPLLPAAGFERIYVLGTGTSYYAALTCKYVFEEFLGVPTEGIQAHAFAVYQRDTLLSERTLVIAFSNSGDNVLPCESLAKAKSRGAFTIAVTAMPNSPITGIAHGVVLTGAQKDMGVPHTKVHTRGLFSLYLTAIRLGERYGTSTADTQARIAQVNAAVSAIVQVVQAEDTWRRLAEEYAGCRMVAVLGMGPNTGTAGCGALMVTELAKIYSVGYELEDFMHGRFRGVDQANPMLLLGPEGKGISKLLHFLSITGQIGVPTVVLSDIPGEGMARWATKTIAMPGGLGEIFTPLVYLVPLHLFGYHLALVRGWDPVSPRYTVNIGAHYSQGAQIGPHHS